MGILYTLQTSLSNHRPRRSTPNHFLQFFIHPTSWGFLSNNFLFCQTVEKIVWQKIATKTKWSIFFYQRWKKFFFVAKDFWKIDQSAKRFLIIARNAIWCKNREMLLLYSWVLKLKLAPFYDVTEYLRPLNPWSLQGSAPEVDKFSFGLFWRCKVLVRQFLAETQNNECLNWATSSLAFAKFQPADKIPLMLKNHAA